nr:YadA family autotransporter adhesin [Fusobacterium nucleatum]
MKKFKGMVILGSFIFINSVGFTAYVTDTQFNALKNHYNNFGKSMQDWTNKTSGEINTINTNVTNLNNQVTTLNTQFNQAMSSINDNALVKDGSNVKASQFRGNLDVYSKNEVDNSLGNKADKNDVYTKNEIDNNLNGKADTNNVYTKNEVDNSLNGKANKNNVYTKTEVNNLLASQATGTVINAATGIGSTALGEETTVSGNYSTAIGYKNKVSGNNSGAFGDPNIVTGNGSYAIGNDNTINGNYNFVLGNNVTIGSSIQNSVALGNNSTITSSNEVSVGSATQQRKITNVADGEVSATSTDAVTGKQLYSVIQNVGTAGIENLRNEVNEKISNVKDEVNYVGSLSAALAGLHPMQYDPKAPTQVMAALGNYKNKQSVAVGLSYYFNDRFMVSTGVAIGGEKRTKSMANVGFTLKLGKGSGVTYQETPQYVVQNEVKRLTVENQELKERVKNLEDKLNKILEVK